MIYLNKFKLFTLFLVLSLHLQALAVDSTNSTTNFESELPPPLPTQNIIQPNFDIPAPENYYLFNYNFAIQKISMSPLEQIQILIKEKIKNILQWNFANQQPQWPQEKYQRTTHFGRWINDPNDDTCYNTRAQVLIRDSHAEVTYRGPRSCTVDTGLWNDPYSGKSFTSSRQIQIDHVVPLKHAFQTGAFKWDYQARCLYANYMGDINHLLSVSAHENTSKGDRSPNKYMPDDDHFACSYLKIWLKIKFTWNLIILPQEAQAIQSLVKTHQCATSDFEVTEKQYEEQQLYIQNHLSLCKLKML